MNKSNIDLTRLIQDCPNFPKEGILFRDINPVFRNSSAMKYISNEFYHRLNKFPIDNVAGIESRGFVIAAALSLVFDRGIILIRKAGKLPGETIKQTYDIEYGNATMEIQKDAVKKGQNIVIADDLIATGGTAIAAAHLIKELGGKVVAFAFVIELAGLGGANKLRKMGYQVQSLVVYQQ